MGKLSCFSAFVGRKKKDKGDKKSLKPLDLEKAVQTLHVRIEHPVKSINTDERKLTSFSVPVPFPISGSSRCKVQVMSHESPVGREVEEVAYEGEDEHDEMRDYSDCDLQAHIAKSNEENNRSLNEGANIYNNSFDTEINYQFDKATDKDEEASGEIIQSGHVSDPGIGKAEFWASPRLKRTCSNLESSDLLKKMAAHLPPLKSQSFEGMQSPASVMTHGSADKVMLKKHSSSQILPSRSRRLWWKLFLWSHRNLHKPPISSRKQPLPIHIPFKPQGGYSSDTLEPNRFMELGKLGSPSSYTGESLNKGNNNNDNQSWDGFHGGSGLWPQNQWVAFPTVSSTSSLTRVDEWVKELSSQPSLLIDNEEHADEEIIFPPSPDTGKSPARTTSQIARTNLPEEIVHANNVIQSLNSSSTVAHISGMGLKVIPAISHFSSLRSVNFSGNYIVQITPGSLPKGLHTLNLSRNKITTIDGLRELSRLRVLDLSYNKISRIGQGLSNCTNIKELCLAGNKISYVEGLHRLLKLTILDLSFNKITTAKALGQLVANYNSLLALNLLGNPIQSNISEDQLRKAVCGLLPKLAFLNKQPINPQKAREVATEAIARAAVGSSGWSACRKAGKRSSQGGASSARASNASVAHKSKHRLRSRSHHQSSTLRAKSYAHI
ncbi:hypothetical protein LguiA_006409 [Lonicera macranthoides]